MALDNKKLALLKNRLQMPLIVRQLINAEKTPGDDEIYAMHHMLSDYSIEDALLCSAFVMKEIAATDELHPYDVTLMHMECERLIDHYAARDDMAQENPELWAETQTYMLEDMAEDIESLIDILALCKLSFENNSACVNKIVDILGTQLKNQLLIIDEIISMHHQEQRKQINASPLKTVTTQNNFYNTDNIIQFPLNRTHH